jgi:hypothetical protein
MNPTFLSMPSTIHRRPARLSAFRAFVRMGHAVALLVAAGTPLLAQRGPVRADRIFQSSGNGDGYASVSVEVQYRIAECAGDIMLLYGLTPNSWDFGGYMYVYKGKRLEVPARLRSSPSTADFVGRIYHADQPSVTLRRFNDPYTHNGQLAGCLGQTLKVGPVSQFFSSRPTQEALQSWLNGLVVEIDRLPRRRNTYFEESVDRQEEERIRAEQKMKADIEAARERAEKAKNDSIARERERERDRQANARVSSGGAVSGGRAVAAGGVGASSASGSRLPESNGGTTANSSRPLTREEAIEKARQEALERQRAEQAKWDAYDARRKAEQDSAKKQWDEERAQANQRAAEKAKSDSVLVEMGAIAMVSVGSLVGDLFSAIKRPFDELKDMKIQAYRAWLTSYTAEMKARDDAVPNKRACSWRADARGAIVMGESKSGSVVLSDCRNPSTGAAAHVYTLTLAKSRAVRLRLASSTFKAPGRVSLLDDSGDLLATAADKDRIGLRLSEGTYRVVVQAGLPGEEGEYKVAMSQGTRSWTDGLVLGGVLTSGRAVVNERAVEELRGNRFHIGLGKQFIGVFAGYHEEKDALRQTEMMGWDAGARLQLLPSQYRARPYLQYTASLTDYSRSFESAQPGFSYSGLLHSYALGVELFPLEAIGVDLGYHRTAGSLSGDESARAAIRQANFRIGLNLRYSFIGYN